MQKYIKWKRKKNKRIIKMSGESVWIVRYVPPYSSQYIRQKRTGSPGDISYPLLYNPPQTCIDTFPIVYTLMYSVPGFQKERVWVPRAY